MKPNAVSIAIFIGGWLTAACAGADLVSIEELGLRVPAGFRITLYADMDLAPDIYCMTLDSKGRVVISSQGYIKTLEDSNADGRADQAHLFATPQTGAMGLCFDGPDLYATADGALLRYRDRDGDKQADGPPEKLFPLKNPEHGAHAIRKGPDGWLYLIGGNDTGFDKPHVTLSHSPIREIEAGALLRITPDGTRSEVIAHGFRNPYDFDFNGAGDIFTYDSDVERDFLLPWYNPTRIYHLAHGGHHGWRLSGWLRSWNRPDYYTDAVDILWSIGRGSPTGVICYRHQQFPKHYWEGLFVLDWAFGKIFFLPLERHGASYRTRAEIFIEPIGTQGLAPTDLVVAPDGALFISIGGRKTRGAVYRVAYRDGRAEADSVKAPPSVATPAFRNQGGQKLLEVLNAPQPLEEWSRAVWVPAARAIGKQPFLKAIADSDLWPKQRVRAIEIVTELFGGLSPEASAAASEAASPEVRARAAWSLGRLPNQGLRSLLELALDEDPTVRRAALEAIGERGNDFDPGSLGAVLTPVFVDDDKRVRQAAARVAARLPEESWRKLWEDMRSADAQAVLTACLAGIWRSTGNQPALERALSILQRASDPELRLQSARLIMMGLGDYQLTHPSVEVYTGYELAGVKGDEAFLQQALPILRRNFPSDHRPLDWEIARLLAMFEDPNPESAVKLVNLITPASSPIDDFHYLVVISRLPGALPEELGWKIVDAILGLEGKLKGQELRTKQTWTMRLTEMAQGLVKRNPRLIERFLNHPALPRPAHVELVSAFDLQERRRAARRFLEAVKQDSKFPWSGSLIELLGLLPAEEVCPLFRMQWSHLGLRDALVSQLAKKPKEQDREKFLEGLDSNHPEVVQASLSALERLPRDPDPEHLVAMIRLLRKRASQPMPVQLGQQTVNLIERQTGRSFGINYQSGRGSIKPEFQTVFSWFEREYPEHASKVSGQSPEELRQWAEILRKVDWSKGDAQRGERLFSERACQTCHEGSTALGPNLSGATRRYSLEDLFWAILFPDRDVAPAYQVTEFATRDGQSYSGLEIFVSADGVIVQTGASTTVRLADDEIVSRRPSDRSLMPSGLLAGLQHRDLADLYLYLRRLEPEPAVEPR